MTKKSWVDKAAQDIMNNLDDRRGVLDDVDAEVRKEMTESIAELIRKRYEGSL